MATASNRRNVIYNAATARDLSTSAPLRNARLPIPRVRHGGPGRPRRSRRSLPRTRHPENYFNTGTVYGSHMPLDIDIHWHWRNPLNIVPASILLLLALALGAMVWA
jgi:hypothetical protein